MKKWLSVLAAVLALCLLPVYAMAEIEYDSATNTYTVSDSNSKYDDIKKQWVPFDPNCAIAHSWQRLMLGRDIKPHDRTLILHELFEMEIKRKNPNISHTEAHRIATKKYNYAKESDEYYANLEKHKKRR